MKYFILFTFIFLTGCMIRQNLTMPDGLGVKNGALAPCPNTPNCYRSGGAVLPLPKEDDQPLIAIELFFIKNYDAEVILLTPKYLHLVVKTPTLRFRDDVEFLVHDNHIDFRSASRVGYSDLGMNKKRIEHLRKEFM